MKLCNHRMRRTREGRCWLRCADITGSERRHAAPVFMSDGSPAQMYKKWTPDISLFGIPSFECTKEMAEVCPYRFHSPRPKPDPCKWIECQYCGGRHRTQNGYMCCKATTQFDTLKLPPFNPEGTIEACWSEDILSFSDGNGHSYETVRAFVWPHLKWAITDRDERTCQDCGTKRSVFEVHHIIPRIRGGSDHPTNLKLLCDECHRKYTDETLRERANERVIERKRNGIATLEKYDIER